MDPQQILQQIMALLDGLGSNYRAAGQSVPGAFAAPKSQIDFSRTNEQAGIKPQIPESGEVLSQQLGMQVGPHNFLADEQAKMIELAQQGIAAPDAYQMIYGSPLPPGPAGESWAQKYTATAKAPDGSPAESAQARAASQQMQTQNPAAQPPANMNPGVNSGAAFGGGAGTQAPTPAQRPLGQTPPSAPGKLTSAQQTAFQFDPTNPSRAISNILQQLGLPTYGPMAQFGESLAAPGIAAGIGTGDLMDPNAIKNFLTAQMTGGQMPRPDGIFGDATAGTGLLGAEAKARSVFQPGQDIRSIFTSAQGGDADATSQLGKMFGTGSDATRSAYMASLNAGDPGDIGALFAQSLGAGSGSGRGLSGGLQGLLGQFLGQILQTRYNSGAEFNDPMNRLGSLRSLFGSVN
jgi:hypothetical protein